MSRRDSRGVCVCGGGARKRERLVHFDDHKKVFGGENILSRNCSEQVMVLMCVYEILHSDVRDATHALPLWHFCL